MWIPDDGWTIGSCTELSNLSSASEKGPVALIIP